MATKKAGKPVKKGKKLGSVKPLNRMRSAKLDPVNALKTGPSVF